MIDYIEIICAGVCAFFCVLHIVVNHFINKSLNKSLNKKIDRLCDKCGLPVYEYDEHSCPLSDQQLNKVVELIQVLRGDKDEY